ncbi:SusC/RagA family TonB-linked outer membrane protein [Chryseosolibacter indicus]|uniref:TonB-dependent receptor n=1 Tax=Chryseosolibacter indicus TaxID=2782351 RepID=A0ABS5VWV7_9BACT|nr:TonB-dependent receptor [Chryseosolibacter indicus]MBT1705716.1 TonB-dependent receptor [Chryseosolibacter indicus]
MKKFLRCSSLWLIGFLLFHFQGVAQSNTITGTVISASNNTPLPGVTVALKGKSRGTVTDSDGRFSIVAEPNDVLVFSFIGMETYEQTAGASSDITISLKENLKSLEEIVIVGYGEQKKTNLTGAVASVDTKVLESRPIADVGRGLQGSTPGLNIVIPSGEVGSDPLIRIRGQFASMQGGASPLILLDNVEIPSLQLVNPNDIESISVLKDAASASIYGAKGAFGVILITTKKGAKKEGVTVSYQGNLSFQNLSKEMKMAGIDGMEYTLLAAERVGSTASGAFWYVTREGYEKAKEWQQQWGDIVKPNDPMLYGRDWYVNANAQKVGLRMYDPYEYMIKEWTPTQIHDFSVNGLSGKTNYNLGFGYLDQTGLIKPAKKDDFSRYNGSIQIGTEVNKWLKFNVGAIYSKRVKNYAYATNSTTADPWLYLYRWASTYPMTTEDGDPIRSPAYEIAAANTAFQERNYTTLNGGLTITPIKNWTIKFDFTHANEEYISKRPGTRFTARDSWSAAVPKNDENGNRIYVNNAGEVVAATDPGTMPAFKLNQTTYTAPGANPDHVYRIAQNDQRNTINLFSTYDLSLNEDQNFKFMLGMNRVGYKYASNWSQITALADISNPQFDLAGGTQTAGGAEYWDSQLGFFGRVNYNYKEKYLLEANMRYDGTSKFPKDLRWRWFPSFSAGWRVSEESWMDWASAFLDEFKVRGSWGTIGDQSVPNNLYLPLLNGGLTNWVVSGVRLFQFGAPTVAPATPGYSTPLAVSSSVTWQDITTLDLGADVRVLKGALGIAFDWFRRDTENMIVPMEGIPATFGNQAPQSNFGSLRTKGIELQLDYTHQFENGLRLNFVGTFADAVTKITKYGSTKSIGTVTSPSWYVGRTYGEIWGYETDRLYQSNDFIYDGNGKLVTTVVNGVTINQLADENGATQEELQSGNFRFGPGDVKFKDLNGDGVINDGNRLLDDHGDLKVIGNSTPRYEYSFRAGADFKGIDFNIFFQGIGKRELWGEGFLAIPGFNAADGAMPQAFAGNFWREDRTNAFYPRPYNQAGSSTTLNMQPQTRYLLNMAYLRIKNITLGYTLPLSLTQRVHLSKVRIYGSLENFFTFHHLGDLPIDPEVVSGVSMWRDDANYNSGRTGVGVPTFKSASVGLQLSF